MFKLFGILFVRLLMRWLTIRKNNNYHHCYYQFRFCFFGFFFVFIVVCCSSSPLIDRSFSTLHSSNCEFNSQPKIENVSANVSSIMAKYIRKSWYSENKSTNFFWYKIFFRRFFCLYFDKFPHFHLALLCGFKFILVRNCCCCFFQFRSFPQFSSSSFAHSTFTFTCFTIQFFSSFNSVCSYFVHFRICVWMWLSSKLLVWLLPSTD